MERNLTLSSARPCVVDMALQASGAQLVTLLLTGSIGTSEDTQKIIRTIKKFGVSLLSSPPFDLELTGGAAGRVEAEQGGFEGLAVVREDCEES